MHKCIAAVHNYRSRKIGRQFIKCAVHGLRPHEECYFEIENGFSVTFNKSMIFKITRNCSDGQRIHLEIWFQLQLQFD